MISGGNSSTRFGRGTNPPPRLGNGLLHQASAADPKKSRPIVQQSKASLHSLRKVKIRSNQRNTWSVCAENLTGGCRREIRIHKEIFATAY